MKKALIVTAAIAVLVAVAGLTTPGGTWDGRVIRPIRIQIEGADGIPVQGATVMLVQGLDGLTKHRSKAEVIEDYRKNAKEPLVSNENGTAELTGLFGAGGGFGNHGRTGRFIVTGDIYVFHDDYSEFSAPLTDLIGERRVSLEKKELGLTIFLEPNKEPNKAEMATPRKPSD